MASGSYKIAGCLFGILGLCIAHGASWASGVPSVAARNEALKADARPPWPLSTLMEVPIVMEADGYLAQRVAGVRSLLIQGLPYRGKPTQVFAYYSAPEGLPPAGGWPAVVIAHGGGGTAYAEYVKMWNARGYAAIAMDLYGKVPAPGVPPVERVSLPGGFPDPYGSAPQSPAEEWSYHVVSAIISAHSLLRSFPEVNPEKTCLVGTSWGGIHSCIAAGLDPRFKVVVAVYGCGFLSSGDDSISFHRRFAKGLPWWDPSGYLAKTRAKLFWIAGPNDEDFSPDMRQKSIDLVPYTQATSLVVGLGHSDEGQAYPVIARMIGSVVQNEASFPRLSRPQIDDSQVSIRYEPGRSFSKADLCYTTDTGGRARRVWKTLPAKVDAATVSATLPESTTAFFFNLYETVGEVAPHGSVWPISSVYIERPEFPRVVK